MRQEELSEQEACVLREGGKEKLPRYYKNIGLGFKTPKKAIEGTYIDKKCPFTGNVSIRGRILSGVVTKMKMQRTIIIRRDYLHYIRKYNCFEKHHKNMSVHLSPCFRDVQIGAIVTGGECRPSARQSDSMSSRSQRLLAPRSSSRSFKGMERKDGGYCLSAGRTATDPAIPSAVNRSGKNFSLPFNGMRPNPSTKGKC
ncbi:serine/threonine-protein phosphatase with EF-hands 2 [Platysternon megacephalum]|uniref:Small ribosomal subunit protein uS17 n=1 Tax=Platysternon megacephalum TaxID=55544 RepID=A0A4D9DXH6_9SAUR|nr:serine/threonine-protein phosphatase with EF-hands 2 [Platysternon megacephalum]